MQNSVNHRNFERKLPLSGSAWKHVSSSGVSTRLGARPRGLVRRSRPPRCACRCVLFAEHVAALLARLPKNLRPCRRGVCRHCRSASGLVLSWTSGGVFRLPLSAAHPFRSPPLSSRRGAVPSACAPRRAPAKVRARAPAFLTRHRMRQDYPLNLSISLSGGEETNQDAPSNGE